MPTLDCSVPCSTLHLIDDVGHTKQVKIDTVCLRRGPSAARIKGYDLLSVLEVISSLSRLF